MTSDDSDRYTLFTATLASLGYAPSREHRFCERKWRWDYAWPDAMLALDIQGGVWTAGRHTRGEGYSGDCEKQAEAVLRGWRVLRCTPGQIADGQALRWILRALQDGVGT